MELLSSIDTMSLAELRKILHDNDVKETCSSKKELILQVSDVLQTNMMIHELLSETSESPKCKESSDSLSDPLSDSLPSERDSLRDQQDKEYQESLQLDLAKQSQQVESIEELTEELTEELSAEDLRAKRLLYYSQ